MRARQPHLDAPCLPLANGGHTLARRVQPLQHRACIDQVGLACQRELHAPAGAHEQLCAQFGLQLGDLQAQRRLRDMQALRGAREAQLFGQGNEVTQVPQFH
ncbi:hypothetical protein D3C71_1856200 [compost metagenome]